MSDAPDPGAPDPGRPPDGRGPGGAGRADDTPPMLPSRTAYLLAFGAVVLAGLFGAVIGYGVTDVGSGSAVATFFGTLVGATVAAVGVGVVAVLVLRAMAEWNRQQTLPPEQRPPRQPKRS